MYTGGKVNRCCGDVRNCWYKLRMKECKRKEGQGGMMEGRKRGKKEGRELRGKMRGK